MSFLKSCIKENEKKWFELKDPHSVEFPKKDKILHDTVHGTIRLEKPLVFLIDLPCFQRLRRIHQLGFTDLVYPGAHHTRFEHSIGTSYLSRHFLSNMKYNDKELQTVLSEEMILENQIASLCHDVGHLPYSHVTETLLLGNPDISEIISTQKLENVKIKLAVLWLSYFCAMIVVAPLDLYRPGVIEEVIAGESGGAPITAEVIMFLAIIMLIPAVMPVLSITLKEKANRWVNIIGGIIFAGLSLVGPIEYLATEPTADGTYLILVGIIQIVVAVLIVWTAWKWQED